MANAINSKKKWKKLNLYLLLWGRGKKKREIVERMAEIEKEDARNSVRGRAVSLTLIKRDQCRFFFRLVLPHIHTPCVPLK